MQTPGGPILNHRQAAGAPLHQHGQVATVPAQGGGAVGLKPLQMTQGQDTTGGLPLQHHGVAATAGCDGGEKAAVAAQGGILAAGGGLGGRGRGPSSPGSPSAAPDHEQEQDKERPGGCAVRKVEGAQSSKRELLSRTALEPVLGGEESGEEGAEVEEDFRGSMGAKSASLTLLTGPLELGRMGVPWGTPAAMSVLEGDGWEGPAVAWGLRLERGMASELGTGLLPRRGSESLSRSRRREPNSEAERSRARLEV